MNNLNTQNTTQLGVILAAGMAKRLRPLTDNCPKCLLTVGERTLLQRTVDAMVAAGISELVVVTGYRASMISDFLTDCKLSILEKHSQLVVTDCDGQIIWVVGLRSDNRFRVTEKTSKILRLTLIKD